MCTTRWSTLCRPWAIPTTLRGSGCGISIPHFWIATLVIVFGSLWFRWSPAIEYVPFTRDPLKNLEQFIVPGAILGFGTAANIMRMTRAMMLEVLRQDYIRTAWAKGLRERVVVLRHALRNAMIPVITVIGLQIPVVLGATVILEQIFGLPGISRFLLETLLYRDYPMVQFVNIILVVLVMLINLAVDVSYGLLDPRIRYQ